MEKTSDITQESLIQIIQDKDDEIAQLKRDNAQLQQKLDYFLRQKFSSSSEKFPSNQPSLFGDETDIETEEETQDIEITYRRKKRGNRTTPPESLPHIRVEHDLKEEEKICKCGCRMKRIKEIVSHQYDIIPAKFQVIDNIRFVYACNCKCGEKVKTSKLTPQVLPRHQVTPSFLATIAVEKFEDSMPLERQVKKYKKRFGVEFTTTTFSSWMIKVSQLRLQPIIDRLKELQMQSKYIHADETTLQVLHEEDKTPQQKSYIWLTIATLATLFTIVLMKYSSNRKKTTAEEILEGFSGYLQTDGYAGYNIIANRDDVIQLGCWAHARRRFADIIKSGASDARSKVLSKELVAMVAKLYKIEKKIKEEPPDTKKEIREKESVPILEEIELWCDTHFLEAHAIGGSIARAFTYLKNQFPKLKVYVEDGNLDIDNNMAERHVKPIALGRKNWLFATSTEGADALCNWYSIIETAKANGLDGYTYLKYLLTNLPIYQDEGRDIDELLPWNAKKMLDKT